MPKDVKTKSRKPLKQYRVLRNRDPKKTTTEKTKDGIKFKGGKNAGGRPKPSTKANVLCRQIGKATVCFDKGKPKRADGKKVKPKKSKKNSTTKKKKKKHHKCD